jgi:hypothetical protein
LDATINVLVWGIGVYAKRFMEDKKENVEVIGFIDNNKNLQGKRYYNKLIMSPKDYLCIDFDYLLITSAYSASDIYNQITNLCPPPLSERVVCVILRIK